MKKMLITLGLMIVPAMAMAGGSSANIAVMESTMTVAQVSVASGTTAVDITALAPAMPDRTTIVIQNVDTTSAIYCGGAGVTSTTGFLVSPGGSITINIRPYSQYYAAPIKIYCVSASTAGATKAAVIQGY